MSKAYLATICFLATILVTACQPDDQQQQDDSQKTQVSEHETLVKPIANSDTESDTLSEESAELDAAAFESDYPAEIPTGRLPGLARPTMYWLELTIDPDQPNFSGKVSINVELDTPSQHLWLHGRDITAQSVSAKLADGKIINGS